MRLVQLIIRDQDVVLVLHKRHDPFILFTDPSLMKKAMLINHHQSLVLYRNFWVILLSFSSFSSRNRDNMFAVFLHNRPRNIIFILLLLLLLLQPQKASSFSSQVSFHHFNHKGRICYLFGFYCTLRQHYYCSIS